MPSLTYKAWAGMRQRCLNPNNQDYQNYGGRGITICKEWDSYSVFKKDMGKKPANLTLDRKDNDGPYTPENCRWASKTEQDNNRRERRINYSRVDNVSGLTGVHFMRARKAWEAFGSVNGVKVKLYYGRDFFEACCARKSWEAKHIRAAAATPVSPPIRIA